MVQDVEATSPHLTNCNGVTSETYSKIQAIFSVTFFTPTAQVPLFYKLAFPKSM